MNSGILGTESLEGADWRDVWGHLFSCCLVLDVIQLLEQSLDKHRLEENLFFKRIKVRLSHG